MTPRISVITPSFNQGAYIERTIQSVISQDVQGLEYLVIDGGSNDETVSIIRKYEPQIAYWVSEKDRGVSDAMNKGILRSKAPIIGWLNSDDIYYLDALKTVLDYFDTHPDTDVLYGDANHIDSSDAFIERYPTEDWNWERLKETCFISQPAAFIRRRALDKFGLLDLTVPLALDYELWLRLGKNGTKFDHLPKLLAATRLHDRASTVALASRCHKTTLRVMVRHFGRAPDRWIFNYAHAAAEEKGFRREDRFKFACALFYYSLVASIRWNKRPSMYLLQTSGRWVYGSAKDAIQQRRRR